MSVASDPRVVALLTLGLVAMKALAHARGTPASESEMERALKAASWARMPTRMVRQFLTWAVPLEDHVKTSMSRLEYIYLVFHNFTYTERRGYGSAGTVLMLAELILGSAGDDLRRLRSKATRARSWALRTSKLLDALSRSLRDVSDPKVTETTLRSMIDPTEAETFPAAHSHDGTFPKLLKGAGQREVDAAMRGWRGYHEHGVPIADITEYFGASPMSIVTWAVCDVTRLPSREVALHVSSTPCATWNTLQSVEIPAESKERVFVDTREPCAIIATRLPLATFEDLDACDSVRAVYEWTLRYTPPIVKNGFDDPKSAVWTLRTLASKLRAHGQTLDENNVDSAVYVALAARVIGFSSSNATPEMRNAVFAAVVHVATRVARLALASLGGSEACGARDLNLFYEPTDLCDSATVSDYGELCVLMYDQNLLRYVAPGIEPDALPPPQKACEERVLYYAGWGYVGAYEHEIPAPNANDAAAPPRYFGTSNTWDECETHMLAEGAPAQVHRSRLGPSDAAKAHLAKCGLKTQEKYWQCMKRNTAFRALNVACVALTAQDAGVCGDRTRCSVANMTDADGHVRLVVDLTALSAGVDVAPYGTKESRIDTGRDVMRPSDCADVPVCLVCSPERVHMHFSRGYYALNGESVLYDLYTTDRAVGKTGAVKAYAAQQHAYDRALYDRSLLRVSLAARQWRKDVPAEWLEPEPELRAHDRETDVALGRARAYFRVESERPIAVVVLSSEQPTATMRGEQCSVSILRGVAPTIGFTNAENWSLVINPGSAVGCRATARADTAGAMHRLLALFYTSEIPYSVWTKGGLVRIAVDAQDGPVRFEERLDGASATKTNPRGMFIAVSWGPGDAFRLQLKYTPWSSLFSEGWEGMPVHKSLEFELAEPAKEGRSHVLCLYRDGGLLAKMVCVPLSRSRVAIDVSALRSRDAARALQRAYAGSKCAAYLDRAVRLAVGDAVAGCALQMGDRTAMVPMRSEKEARDASLKGRGAWDEPRTIAEQWAANVPPNALAAYAEHPGVPDAEDADVARALRAVETGRYANAADYETPGSAENASPIADARARFEAATGLVVSAAQMDIVRLAVRSIEGEGDRSSIVPAVMGIGKSAVVIPLLAVYATSMHDVERVVVVTPAHLVPKMHMTLAGVLALAKRAVVLRVASDASDLNQGAVEVLVLSAHEMQRRMLHDAREKARVGIGDYYAASYRERTVMLYDEIDALMDPMQCEYKEPAGEERTHYLDGINARWYHETVLSLTQGRQVAASTLNQNEKLTQRLATVVQALRSCVLWRDFGPSSDASVINAAPYARSAEVRGARFSDVDVWAVLTARLFTDRSRKTIGVGDLPVSFQRKVARIQRQEREWHEPRTTFTEAEACAIAAMETIRVSMAEYSTSFTDIAFLCKRKVAFSGTVAIPRAMPLGSVRGVGWGAVPDDTDSEREILGVLKKADVVFVDEADILNAKTLDGVGCLIDACGALAGTAPSDVVKMIAAALPEVTVSIFVDEKGRVEGRCDAEPRRCFYYFNQQSARGVDVRMPHKLKGAVALRFGETPTTDVAQAVYRMRLVASDVHKVVLLVINAPRGTARDEVIKRLKRAETLAAEAGSELLAEHKRRTEARLSVANQPLELLSAFMVHLNPLTILESAGVSTSTSTSTAKATSRTMIQVGVVGKTKALASLWYSEVDTASREARARAWVRSTTRRSADEQGDNEDHEVLRARLSLREEHVVEEHMWNSETLLLEGNDDSEIKPRYMAHFALSGEGPSAREPIANVTLRTFTWDVRSTALRTVLERFTNVTGKRVAITTRMLLEHPRIDRRYCVVISDESGDCTLATLADLLLEDTARLCDRARIYGVPESSPVTYWVRGEYPNGTTTADAHASPAVLYLLACLGGSLSTSEQGVVMDLENAMRDGAPLRRSHAGDAFHTLLEMQYWQTTIASARPEPLAQEPVRNMKIAMWMHVHRVPEWVAAKLEGTRVDPKRALSDQEIIRSILRGITDESVARVEDAYRQACTFQNGTQRYRGHRPLLMAKTTSDEDKALWTLLLSLRVSPGSRFGRRFV
jgi:hypothetical protein